MLMVAESKRKPQGEQVYHEPLPVRQPRVRTSGRIVSRCGAGGASKARRTILDDPGLLSDVAGGYWARQRRRWRVHPRTEGQEPVKPQAASGHLPAVRGSHRCVRPVSGICFTGRSPVQFAARLRGRTSTNWPHYDYWIMYGLDSSRCPSVTPILLWKPDAVSSSLMKHTTSPMLAERLVPRDSRIPVPPRHPLASRHIQMGMTQQWGADRKHKCGVRQIHPTG